MERISSAVAGPAISLAELICHPSLNAVVLNLPAHAVLFEPTTPATDLYFIQQGQVRIYQVDRNRSSQLLDILGPADWCGSAALAPHSKYGAMAVAIVPSVVTQVSAQRALEFIQHHPAAAVELLRQLAGKLVNVYQQSAAFVFDNCMQRLLKTLLRFSSSSAATRQNDTVTLHITHSQLAQAVGVARETVSLALTQLRLQNVLRTGRNRLIFNPAVIEEFARRSDVSTTCDACCA